MNLFLSLPHKSLIIGYLLFLTGLPLSDYAADELSAPLSLKEFKYRLALNSYQRFLSEHSQNQKLIFKNSFEDIISLSNGYIMVKEYLLPETLFLLDKANSYYHYHPKIIKLHQIYLASLASRVSFYSDILHLNQFKTKKNTKNKAKFPTKYSRGNSNLILFKEKKSLLDLEIFQKKFSHQQRSIEKLK